MNHKQDYHNCLMEFCFFYESDTSDFKVGKEQKYKIHTTLKEVQQLNESLNIYQAEGFKKAFLRYTSEVDGSNKYPEFVIDYIDAIEAGRALQALANDEDSLVQLSEYCIETPPTYVDDFGINKQIDSITVEGQTEQVNGYEDIADYLSSLKEERPSLFS